jgi:hypothetical protein
MQTLSPELARARRQATTRRAFALSRPDVGSSNIRSEGQDSSPTAMLSRRRCPPETPRVSSEPTRVSEHVCSCSVDRIWSM